MHRTTRLLAGLLLAAGSLAGCGTGAAPVGPTDGPALPIGTYTNGCLAGAMRLPEEGVGFQAVNLSRQRNFGHPSLVEYVKALSAQAAEAGLGTLLVGDLAGARGGRLPGMHASHQTGLDVDIWYDLAQPVLPRPQRERDDFPTMVDPATNRVHPDRFGPAQVALLRLAAQDARVTRIFVHPAVKLALCEAAGEDRSWLRTVRPWFGHAAHFHVRLACPADAFACMPQPPPPEGDGCDAELMSWFEPPKPPAGDPKPPAPPPDPPDACKAILGLPIP